jgi:hypothetical protein
MKWAIGERPTLKGLSHEPNVLYFLGQGCEIGLRGGLNLKGLFSHPPSPPLVPWFTVLAVPYFLGLAHEMGHRGAPNLKGPLPRTQCALFHGLGL